MSSYTLSVFKPMSDRNAAHQPGDSLLSVQGSTSLFQETDGVSSQWNSKSVNKAYRLSSGFWAAFKVGLLLAMCQSMSLIIVLGRRLGIFV